MRPNYAVARIDRGKRGAKPHLDDPVYRSNLVSLASTGMSRRGVAQVSGASIAALNDWLARGRAQPDEEPYGSFARDFLRAERGLELAASGTIALIVAQLYRLARAGDWKALEKSPNLQDLARLLASRYPEDWGSSLHRRPEVEPSGDAWLERNGMTHAQLVHLLREPPEAIAEALVEAGPEVMALLIAAGVRVPA